MPTAFNDSLTLLEKVNKVIEYVNELGDISADVFEQWNEVMEWVTGEGLTDEVRRVLNEMADDGTLEELLGEAIETGSQIHYSDTEPESPNNDSFWYEKI